MPSASLGDCTGYSIGRVWCRESTSKAAERSRLNCTQRCHCASKASTAMVPMKVAKASFSQMPFHQRMVTRSPNHMWAISWAMTSATRTRSGCVACCGSRSSSTSRKVTQPRFSMAPKAKSGMATRSSFWPG